MTIDQLIILEVIVKHGSFKQASEKLFKTQPSLSIAIKKLEEELGIKLFSRENYRPTLTQDGKAFYQQARETLKSIKKLEVIGKELGLGVESQIKICADPLLPINDLKSILHPFLDSQINTQISLETEILSGVTEKLLSRKVDLAIGTKLIDDSRIESKLFSQVKIIPVISNDLVDEFDWDLTLNNIPQIIVSTTNSFETSFGILPHGKKWLVDNHPMKENLITQALGWGYLPLNIFKQRKKKNNLKKIKHPLLKEKIIDMYLMRNTEIPFGEMRKKIWNLL
jgi:DNA-binding transcriptional LysR family regulator